MEWLNKLSNEELDNLASCYNGEDEWFLWDGEKLHSDVAHEAVELLNKRLTNHD